MLSIGVCTDLAAWDEQVVAFGGNPLQLAGWGELKAAHGWRALRLEVRDDAAGTPVVALAQVLVRPLPGMFRALCHVPRGPVMAPGTSIADRSAVCDAIAVYARAQVGGVGITFEPDWPAADPLTITGAVPSPNPIFMAETLILDLALDDDTLLAQMAKKTRYEVRKSQRSEWDITPVTTEADLADVLTLYRTTSERAGFGIHSDGYYRDVHTLLGQHSLLLLARMDGEPVAFLWIVESGTTGIDLYGGSNDAGRKALANYALKWSAIKYLRERGVTRYDLNGLLGDDVSAFKRGFANHTDTLVGSIDVPFSMWYSAWNKALPAAKKVVRRLRG
ncbi:Acetyltransferase (GNAT) domain-containing protein [Sanguibacter gelidistatuariae]|uniref:Acetyltransferase (GNAT) domain-containing protein n=1 Tax=Sanguibacter gelidistatuariae TaxID=1814289 RepID=A0A1G6RL03_9MICO|nr:peptidoglycan bridge formation glycyltransferase FemA/FemB family protein [Sanguibacter gelidistatuariae]SDD05312.1 Acetyltransferase (GNAT) domain-containing protein [Sanguibacter gelidistatuariae]